MKKLLLAFLLTPLMCFGVNSLPEKYLVSYGSAEAPITIVEYYSLQCPHCLSLFKRDFKKIEEAYIDTKNVYWVFHPVPADLVTVQAMICLERLDARQKKLYLETMLTEAESNHPEITTLVMSKVMEILKQPLPKLQDEQFIQKSDSFLDAFTFLSQEEKIMAVPTIEVNRKLFPQEVPEFDFVKRIVQK